MITLVVLLFVFVIALEFEFRYRKNKIVINDLYTCVSTDRQLCNGDFRFELDIEGIFGGEDD